MSKKSKFYNLENQVKEVNLTVDEYKELVTNRDPKDTPFDGKCNHEVEKRIKSVMSTITTRTPIYASDIEGTLFPETMKRWNINAFTSDDSLLHRMDKDEWIPGIHYSFVYIGSRGSLFSFHVEDQNLNSISFLHEGAPKIWYGASSEYSPRFEELMRQGTTDYEKCDMPMRHKTIFINRKLLEEAEFDIIEVCSCYISFLSYE